MADRNANRIEYDIVDVGNPERHLCPYGCRQLEQLDKEAKESADRDYFKRADLPDERQAETEWDHQQNVEQRGSHVGLS
ncbi:MAG TPA: hypothetical protein VGC44_13315, partial [Longimicrobiales bacterium]